MSSNSSMTKLTERRISREGLISLFGGLVSGLTATVSVG